MTKGTQAGHSCLTDGDEGLANRGWNDIAISADRNIAQWRAGASWHVINWLLTVLGLWSSGTSGTIELLCTDCPGLARHGIIQFLSSQNPSEFEAALKNLLEILKNSVCDLGSSGGSGGCDGAPTFSTGTVCVEVCVGVWVRVQACVHMHKRLPVWTHGDAI